MSMPKGHTVKRGYATIDPSWGGQDFRSISETMTKDGDKMNHSTARNVFLRAMRSIADRVIRDAGGDVSEANVNAVAKHPMFQQGVAEVLRKE